jgi:hypothetical protein
LRGQGWSRAGLAMNNSGRSLPAFSAGALEATVSKLNAWGEREGVHELTKMRIESGAELGTARGGEWWRRCSAESDTGR